MDIDSPYPDLGFGQTLTEGSGDSGRSIFVIEEKETNERSLVFGSPATDPIPASNPFDIFEEPINPTSDEPLTESTSQVLYESESASSTVMSEGPEISTTFTSTTLENKEFSEREKIILISTIVPAVAIILVLSLLLAYFIFKRQRNFRVGTQEAKEDQEAERGSNGCATGNGRPQTSQSARGSRPDGNGIRNGAARAWESDEITVRHETDNC